MPLEYSSPSPDPRRWHYGLWARVIVGMTGGSLQFGLWILWTVRHLSLEQTALGWFVFPLPYLRQLFTGIDAGATWRSLTHVHPALPWLLNGLTAAVIFLAGCEAVYRVSRLVRRRTG